MAVRDEVEHQEYGIDAERTDGSGVPKRRREFGEDPHGVLGRFAGISRLPDACAEPGPNVIAAIENGATDFEIGRALPFMTP